MSEKPLEIINQYGHKFILDKEAKTLTFSDAESGQDALTINAADHSITINFSDIRITGKDTGQSVTVNGSARTLSISSGSGDCITLDSVNNSLAVNVAKSMSITINGQQAVNVCNADGKTAVTISAAQVTVNSDHIVLGGAPGVGLIMENFIELFNGHCHTDINGQLTEAPREADKASASLHATGKVKGT